MVVALLTAAGVGSRMNLDIPKQFYEINNKPVIVHTMERFQNHPLVDAIMVVTLASWTEVVESYAKEYGISKLKWVVPGGKTGQESIFNGLKVLSGALNMNDIVMVHDGNRCMVSKGIISDSIATQREYGSAVAAIPCTEAVFRATNIDLCSSNESIPREELFRTQTPHTYTLEKLLWAHGEAKKNNITNTAASCTLMHALGEIVYFSHGSEKNIKITTNDDIAIVKALLAVEKSEKE